MTWLSVTDHGHLLKRTLPALITPRPPQLHIAAVGIPTTPARPEDGHMGSRMESNSWGAASEEPQAETLTEPGK